MQVGSAWEQFWVRRIKPMETVQYVAYFSWKLREAETWYSAMEIECLAAVDTMRYFRVYLLASEFKLVIDDQALVHLRKFKNENGRLHGQMGISFATIPV